MVTYTIYKNSFDETMVQRTDDNGQVWSIPCDERNSDYQAYLAYVANGNQTPTTQ